MFQKKLKLLMHRYIKHTYSVTKSFPKEELYSSVSQIRRASLSVALNYIEGYARRRKKVQLNFYEMSYGSLKESKYLFYFALDQKWISKDEYAEAIKLADEIGAMLWSEIESAQKSIDKGF